MTKPKFKKTKGNEYRHHPEFAEEVAAANVKHPGQNNPSEGARKND